MYWYKNDVDQLIVKKTHLNFTPRTFFYGSSSIRLWEELETTFKKCDAINLGFGGSSLAACTWYFEQVFESYNPQSIILYAGDNDLADGRHPEEIILYLEKLKTKIRRIFGNEVRITFISIKPSKSRWHLIDSIKYTNQLVQNIAKKEANFFYVDIFNPMLNKDGLPNPIYFTEDELHLSPIGYDLWREILRNNPHIFPQSCKEYITNGTAQQ